MIIEKAIEAVKKGCFANTDPLDVCEKEIEDAVRYYFNPTNKETKAEIVLLKHAFNLLRKERKK